MEGHTGQTACEEGGGGGLENEPSRERETKEREAGGCTEVEACWS